jgi:soluble lytic murein transglycosylase-like protein
MAPHDDAKVVNDFSDLIPQHAVNETSADQTVPITAPDGTPLLGANGQPVMRTVPGKTTISMMESDPEASRAIRSVAGVLPSRQAGEGVNVQEITNMISDLRDDAAQGGIDGRAADRAAQHLMDLMQTNVPEAAQATQQMREAYAAHSRMAEGMGEGWQQRLRDEIQVGTSNSRAQGVQNAYDTDEGTAGRQLGTTNRLNSDLSGTPQSAASTTIDLARNGNPAIPENLGQTAADKIQTAADAQAQSLEALSAASRGVKSGESSQLTPQDVATGLLALGPHPFAKARALQKLTSLSILPEGKAKVVADMLFSQDPVLTNRAVQMLGNQQGGAGFLKYLAGTTGQAAADADPTNSASSIPPTPAVLAPAATSADPYANIGVVANEPAAAPTAPAPAATSEDPYANIGSTADPSKDSPYAGKLASIYTQENPDVIDLVQRVKKQESGGNQAAVSKKGAIGTMQVMPKTAPEAAQLAGVPWDPKAYKADPTYNEILGHAYLAQQLRKYNGNVGQALAAYNAGPGAVDKALSTQPEKWQAALPAETQDYVAKVGS